MESSIKLRAIAEQTDVLCETIVSQSGFKKLHSKIEAFMNDEKLKYEYGLLNERGGLLQQKQEYGVEIKPEEFEEFEKMREEFMTNPVATASVPTASGTSTTPTATTWTACAGTTDGPWRSRSGLPWSGRP